jgi:hypothetical protein
MRATVQPLRPSTPTPARSAERQRLAEAIERLSEARADLARLAAARAKTPQPWQVSGEVEAARAALDEARADEPERLVGQLLGEEAHGADPVAVANAALREAEAKLTRSREVRSLLDERERAATSALEAAEGAVRTARAAVLQADPAVVALLAGHREAQRRAAEIAASLGHVGATGIPHAHRHWDDQRHEFATRDLSAAATWAAAVAALATDPDAPLPGDPPPAAA